MIPPFLSWIWVICSTLLLVQSFCLISVSRCKFLSLCKYIKIDLATVFFFFWFSTFLSISLPPTIQLPYLGPLSLYWSSNHIIPLCPHSRSLGWGFNGVWPKSYNNFEVIPLRKVIPLSQTAQWTFMTSHSYAIKMELLSMTHMTLTYMPFSYIFFPM